MLPQEFIHHYLECHLRSLSPVVSILLRCDGCRHCGDQYQIPLQGNAYQEPMPWQKQKGNDVETLSRTVIKFGVLGAGSIAVTVALCGLGAGTATADTTTTSGTDAQSQATDVSDATSIRERVSGTNSLQQAALPSLKSSAGKVTINTSLPALQVKQNSLDADRNMTSAVERLNTGKRITSAAR